MGGIRKCGIREWDRDPADRDRADPDRDLVSHSHIRAATTPHKEQGMADMAGHVRHGGACQGMGGDVRAWGGMPGHGGAWRCMGGAARRVGSGELCGCRAASASLLCRTKSLIVRAVISHGSQSSLRAASGILRCCFILSLALTQLCRP